VALRLVPIESETKSLRLVPIDEQGYPRVSQELSDQFRRAQREANNRAMTHTAPPRPPPSAPWRDVLGDIPRQVRAGLASTIAGVKLKDYEELQRAEPENPRLPALIERELGVIGEAQADLAPTPNATVMQRGVQQAASSLVQSVPALGIGLLTRNPTLAAASMYPTTAGQKYGEMRAGGVPEEQASKHAALQGAVESGTELLPFDYLLRAGSGPIKQTLGFLARELPGESLAQLAQGADDYVVASQEAGKTLTPELVLEGFMEASRQLPETWVATMLAGAAQSAPVAVANRFQTPQFDTSAVRDVASRGVVARGTRLVPITQAKDTTATQIPPEQYFIGNRLVPGTGGTLRGEYTIEQPKPRPAPIESEMASDEPWDAAARPPIERLASDNELRRSLQGLAKETGWDTRGGRVLMADDGKTVIGRTQWLPRYPWFKDKPTAHNEKQVQSVIDKMLAGKKLGSQEQVLANWLAEVAADRIKLEPLMPTSDELLAAGLEDNLADAHEAALAARALEVDPDEFERLAIRYQDDDQGFLRAIRKLVDDADAATGRSRAQDQPAPRQVLNHDLFAGSDKESESLARRNAVEAERIRREGRLTGDVPVETGRPDDLFSQSREQTDLTDDLGPVQGVVARSWAPGSSYVGMLEGSSPVMPQTLTIGQRAGDERTLAIPEKPIRRELIMEEFQRAFGVKVYEGRPFKVRSALGFFRPQNFEVRVKRHNDLEVTAHEVFHWLDRTFPTIRKLYHEPRFRQQLKDVSYDQKDLMEGFAEFGRLYMTQETQAAAKAPEFYDAFVTEVHKLGIYDKMKSVQNKMHQWYAQGAEARALSKIGGSKPPMKQRLVRLTDGWQDRLKTWGLDFTHPAKMVEGEIGYNTQNRDAADSLYKQLRLLQHTNSTVEAVLNYGTPQWTSRGELQFSGKGLRAIFESVADVMDDAIAFFVGRRANELMSYGKEHLFSPDEVRALLAKGQNSPKAAEIRKAFEEYQAYTDRLMTFAVKSGLISGDTVALWKRMYQNYVPFHRLRETLADTSSAAGGPFSRLVGGTENLRDIWQNMVDNTAMIVQASLRNVAKRNLFSEISRSPKGQRFAVRIPTDTKEIQIAMTQVESNLRALVREAEKRANDPDATDADRAHYLQVAQALEVLTGSTNAQGGSALQALQSQATFFLQHQTPGITDRDYYLSEGKPQWFQIGDRLVWQMLQEFNTYKPLSTVEKMLTVAKRTLTRGVTLAPEFQLANFARDTYNAFVLSNGGQKPLIDGLRAAKDIFTVSDDLKLFFLNGGAFGLNAKESGEAIKLELERLRRISGKVNIHAILDTPAKLLRLYDKFSQTSELATRVAEFKRMRKNGASLREAAYQANEISTDFAARGTSKALNALRISVPFFGARLQGLGRLGREINEHPVRLATRALLGITIPTMILQWINEDDERYQALTSETKSLYWVVLDPSGDGVYLIPKPFEVGALFATMPERGWESFKAGTSKPLADATKFALLDTFSFNPIPQLIRPPIELVANYDMFRRSRIVPEHLKVVAPQEQFTQYTPRSMVAIGEAFSVSPMQLEHLVRGYLGTLGTYGIAAADALVSKDSIPGEEPENKLAHYPIAKRFRRQEPYTRTQWEQDFYRMLEESREVVATANHMRDTLRPGDAQNYLEQRAARFGRARALEKVKRSADKIDDAMKVIRFDPTLSAAEKRRQLDELQAAKNQLYRTSTLQLVRIQ
jgi:hypothetical protein